MKTNASMISSTETHVACNICKCIALFAKDPHLLLYAFLPVLLFGDAMSIVAGHDFGDHFRAQESRSLTFSFQACLSAEVWHDFQRTAAQCMVLAGLSIS